MMVNLLNEKQQRGLKIRHELHKFAAKHKIKIDSIVFTVFDDVPNGQLSFTADDNGDQWSMAWSTHVRLSKVK